MLIAWVSVPLLGLAAALLCRAYRRRQRRLRIDARIAAFHESVANGTSIYDSHKWLKGKPSVAFEELK